MKININRCRNLELFKGEPVNDQNKEYWMLIKVSPIKKLAPADSLDEEVQVVGVCDGIARIYPIDGLGEIKTE